MEQHEREYFLYKILSGYVVYTTNGKRLKIYHPYGEILQEGAFVYIEARKQALEDGVMTESDAIDLLKSEDLWSDEKEKNYQEVLPKHIEYWKKQLYLSFFKSEDRKTIRKYLRKAKQEYEEMHNIRHKYHANTCDGVASYSRLQFFIENLTRYNGKKYKWTEASSVLAISEYQANLISDDKIREISRTAPWNQIWSCGKKINNIFGKTALELTNEQLKLISYSSMYDSIHEHPESPSDDIISDDDSLDGWMLLQREKRESKMKESNADKLLSEKHRNADEVYFVAQTLEDAQKIDALNSHQARAVKKQRFNTIRKHGEVHDIMLPDMQQKLQMAINRQ